MTSKNFRERDLAMRGRDLPGQPGKCVGSTPDGRNHDNHLKSYEEQDAIRRMIEQQVTEEVAEYGHRPESYAAFKARFEAKHGALNSPPGFIERVSGPRQFQEPREIEGPVSTVISGLTGQAFTVPRLDDEDVPEAPEVHHRSRKRSQRYWCSVCLRNVPDKEARAGHVHDIVEADLRPPSIYHDRPAEVNANHKPVKRRKQTSKSQGLAGGLIPRSQ